MIKRASKQNALNKLLNKIQVYSTGSQGDNLEISTKGTNVKRNEAILNNLINATHNAQIKDKQEIYTLSIDFINDRLITIKNEIDSLSFQTIGFRSDNLIFSADAQTSTALNSISTINERRFMLETQKALAELIRKNLEGQEDYSLLPSNIGLTNGNVNELVLSYNEMILNQEKSSRWSNNKKPNDY